MSLIKKVVDYLLANPLYAIVVAVCFVAIVAVIVALCVKSSKAKKSALTTKEPKQSEVVSVKESEPVAEKQVSVIEETALEEETIDEPIVDTPAVPVEETAPVIKTPVVKVEQKQAVPEKKASATAPVKSKPQPKATAPQAPVVTEKTAPVVEASAPVAEATVEVVSDVNVKKSTRYNGKWLIWRLLTKTSENDTATEESYFFELVASNGEKLLSSEEYTSFAGAQKGIQTHKANILKNNFRVSLTKKGDYIFKLLSGKNTLLCTGENYPTKIRCENAVESTKRFAETAVIDENVHDLIIQLPPEDSEDNTVEPDNGYNGKWIISSMLAPDGDQIFYFELFASNGEKLLSSEEYATYNGVINGIATHKSNIERNNFRISLTKRGDYIFKLLNANEQLLCLGEHYKTRRRCERAVESVKRFAKTAPIMDSPSVKKYSQN